MVPDLEIREGGRILSGLFKYGEQAVVADRGRARKEVVEPGAFSYALEDEEREINLLLGHSFDQPLASRKAGTLTLKDTAKALLFEASLPAQSEQPTWMVDAVKSVRNGLIGGISPAFKIPPDDVVPDALEMIPEPGNPGVYIRVVRAAVLYEISLVSRPAYPETEIENRHGFPTSTEKVNIWPLKVY